MALEFCVVSSSAVPTIAGVPAPKMVGTARKRAFAHPTGPTTYRILNRDFFSQIIYTSPQPCSRRGVFSRGEPERPSKVWRPRSGLRPHVGGQRPAPLVARPQEQPLLPGPGKNENKMLGRVQKTSRWSAERRGVG